MHLPFQTVECFMAIEPTSGSTWSQEARYLNSKLHIYIMFYNPGEIFMNVNCFCFKFIYANLFSDLHFQP